jgi:hypothetical protein
MSLVERHLDRALDNPPLVVVLDGWVDAGLGATGAMAHLLGSGSTELLASFDTEQLVDYRSRRPVAKIVDGVTEQLGWPEIEMRLGRDMQGAEVCYLVGAEPDLRWRGFVNAVVGTAVDIGVRMAVGLGAFPAAAPHTRPVRLAATVPEGSVDLGRGVGIIQGTIEVPSGIWGVLEQTFGDAGVPAVGLWARVPHYVSTMPFPPASAALIDGLAAVTGLTFDSGPLHAAADATLSQVDELIARSTDHQEMVRQLESSIDAVEGNPLDIGQVPTGDELAAELERYLREHGSGPPGSD